MNNASVPLVSRADTDCRQHLRRILDIRTLPTQRNRYETPLPSESGRFRVPEGARTMRNTRLEIRLLSGARGAEIGGVDVAQEVDEGTVAEIRVR